MTGFLAVVAVVQCLAVAFGISDEGTEDQGPHVDVLQVCPHPQHWTEVCPRASWDEDGGPNGCECRINPQRNGCDKG